MDKLVAVFPVLEGKDARAVADMLSSRKDEYLESRGRLGVTLERAYEQVTPMGTFVLVYSESEGPFMEVLGKTAASELPIDQDFVAAVQEVHGADLTQPPPGEAPELLADWVDEDVTDRRRGLAFCAPVMPGATDTGRAFTKEAWGERRDEFTASRRALGITRETVVLNHTPMGDVICVYLEGEDPVEGNRLFAESRSEFDVWFKDQCRTIFPPEIDFDAPLPPITEVFDSLALAAE